MRELGILYTPENIRAIAEKRKWQTRRVIDLPPGDWEYSGVIYQGSYRFESSGEVCFRRPCYRVGDVLYVKEAWRIGGWDGNDGTVCIDYKADGYSRRDWAGVPTEEEFMRLWVDCSDDCRKAGIESDTEGNYSWKPGESPCRWRSPLYMPKWAARPELKRRVTEVRVQRVQDISEEDAIAEGIDYECVAPKEDFRRLWDSINGKKYPWDSNPWVFAYTFEGLL